jgi:zinc protease
MTFDITVNTLDNGLTVILKEMRAAPVISTWLWYRVGSRNEIEGATGLSHWVEHMMFKGSPRFPKGSVMRAVDRLGGYTNAMTSHDFTAYYATLPSQWAELALEIEADRMSGAIFDPQEVQAERTVILSEREGNENQPRYVLAEEMSAVAFHLHPYHHQTIGWKEDLREIDREQLYDHYRRYYVPNNAILVVVGDLDASYFDVVERHFGDIPAGPEPPQGVRAEPIQRGERRVTVRMPGAGDLVRIAHRTPPVSHPDYLPMVVLDAVLSGGKAMFAFDTNQTRSARLYRALVEADLASSAGSNYHPSLDPYLHNVGAVVRRGRSAQEVEDALVAEISRLQDELVSQDELHTAIHQTRAQFAYSSETVTSQALTLGMLEIVDCHQRMDTIFDELVAVTPEDVLRVAQTYLAPENRVVGWFLPTEETGAEPRLSTTPVVHCISPCEPLCFYSSAATIGPETVQRAVLDNGITVLVKENPASLSVTIEAEMNAGGAHETDETAGLAGLTAHMLRRGTARHTFQELNRTLDAVGASIDLSADSDDASLSTQSLAADLPLVLDLLTEMLTEPTIPTAELERVRGQVLTNLHILNNDTRYRADQTCMELLYPTGHPYARPTMGTHETIAALKREDLQAFYQRCYHPERLTIAVVGAIEADDVIARIADTLGSWSTNAQGPERQIPDAQTPTEPQERRVELPGKSQVDLVWGTVGMRRSSPDYYAAMMGNIILGRLGLMGRLGARVRDEQGLAYYTGSSLSGGRGPHPWIISAGLHPDHVQPALASILEEVRRLRDELVDEEELADCRAFLTGVLPLALESNSGIAQFLLGIETYALGLDYLARYPDILAGVSREDIQRTARYYLTLDGYALAMAGTF